MSKTVEPLLRNLIQKQNGDGGWGYGSGTSWTEPTCYALLALQAWEADLHPLRRGREWLLSQQRADGGWAPQRLVQQSTWVTSLASIFLAGDELHRVVWERSVLWLDRQTGQTASSLDRLRAWLFADGVTRSNAPGWSWVPGTASWVTPTALAIVALSKAREQFPERLQRMHQGREFLLSRRCADGGWNHGGSFVRSESALSYPETTGMALVGLQGMSQATLARSLTLAESSLAHAGSVEATSWLRIALVAHGRTSPVITQSYACRTSVDFSLQLLAEAAQSGKNMFAVQSL